jgi:hypothetical protein
MFVGTFSKAVPIIAERLRCGRQDKQQRDGELTEHS